MQPRVSRDRSGFSTLPLSFNLTPCPDREYGEEGMLKPQYLWKPQVLICNVYRFVSYQKGRGMPGISAWPPEPSRSLDAQAPPTLPVPGALHNWAQLLRTPGSSTPITVELGPWGQAWRRSVGDSQTLPHSELSHRVPLQPAPNRRNSRV